jgi:hypothetical protein
MLHRFRRIEDAKAADRRIGGVFEFEKMFEREFFEVRHHGEGREFRASERPGWSAAASDEEQEPARAEKARNIFDRQWAKCGRENLERVGLKNKMKKAAPGGRQLEQIGGEMFDGCAGKTFARRRIAVSEILNAVVRKSTSRANTLVEDDAYGSHTHCEHQNERLLRSESGDGVKVA